MLNIVLCIHSLLIANACTTSCHEALFLGVATTVWSGSLCYLLSSFVTETEHLTETTDGKKDLFGLRILEGEIHCPGEGMVVFITAEVHVWDPSHLSKLGSGESSGRSWPSCNSEGQSSSDWLPPVKPHLPKVPQLPKQYHQLGDQRSKHELVGTCYIQTLTFLLFPPYQWEQQGTTIWRRVQLTYTGSKWLHWDLSPQSPNQPSFISYCNDTITLLQSFYLIYDRSGPC